MSRRKAFNGAALIRLLSRLTDIDVPESRLAFSDRLGRWVAWTDAIALSAALDANADAAATPGPPTAPSTGDEAVDRTRSALSRPLEIDHPPAPDFRPYRRRYHARQQAMEAGVGALRADLRARLAARSPALARLAALDSAMEQVLQARERSLLSTVPVLLERRFDRVCSSAGSDEGKAAHDLRTEFHQDLQAVLLAELDVRMQPVEGLIEALRQP